MLNLTFIEYTGSREPTPTIVAEFDLPADHSFTDKVINKGGWPDVLIFNSVIYGIEDYDSAAATYVKTHGMTFEPGDVVSKVPMP